MSTTTTPQSADPTTAQTSHSADAKKVPLLIFTGFLGSGKTTLVNHLITHNTDRKIGIVVNEFGEVGFDSEIIQTEEEVKVEISNGCACCVVRDDLESGVQALLKKVPDLDYIFIEASGLAEPEPIVQTFVHNIAFNKSAYLDATICTIDTVNFVRNWDEFETLQQQIAYSDFVVLTKIHEPESKKDKVMAVLKKAKPDLVMLEFDPAQPESVGILLDTHSFELHEIEHEKHEHHHKDDSNHDVHNHHHHHEEFDEIVYLSEKKLDPMMLDEVFKQPHFQNIVRAKGFLNFTGEVGKHGTMIFQLVGHGRQLSPYTKNFAGNKLVMIGKHLETQKLLADLARCER